MNTQQPQALKLIFRGRLEFGARRTYDMVLKHWQTRTESYFKTDILFKIEQVFDENDFSLTVPSATMSGSEKYWRSTMSLLQEISQYAVVGKISSWCLDNGRLIAGCVIEPVSDKVAVSEYRRGCELALSDGMEEASAALSRAIEKYERHALAYERRGYVNYKLRNYNDALYDFSKSIAINPNNPEPYYGRGKVKMLKNDWEGAAQDFDTALKRSVALQPIYWLARLKKGESLFHAKQYDLAITELQLFLKREFKEDDPNFRRRRKAYYQLGKAMLEINRPDASIESFNQGLALHSGADLAPEADGLLYRGIAKHKAGAKEYASDLAAAARMGSAEAARLLEEWV